MMKNITLYIDLAFCLIFLPLMIVLMPKENWMLEKYPQFLVILIIWLSAIYIINRKFTIPLLMRKYKEIIIATAIIIGSALTTIPITHVTMFAPLYGNKASSYDERQRQRIIKLRLYRQTVWLFFIITETFSFSVGLLTEVNRQRTQRQALKNERDKAELAFYKAQINPHFLLNMLNTLYGLFITHSDKTETTMEHLINLAKYLVINTNRNFISLGEEMEYIEQYIGLQSLRLNEMIHVSFTHRIETPESQLPPMLLITFIENTFKHGISSNEECFIRIDIRQEGKTLNLDTENKVFPHAVKHENSRRMGLDNCNKRLALLYPGQYRLQYEIDSKGIFRVHLSFPLIQDHSTISAL